MKSYQFLDEHGSFALENAEADRDLYFPLANEAGLKSAITPNLAGDSKTDQNHFLLEPESVENLHNNAGTRNFWCKIERDGQTDVWSATGASALQEIQRNTTAQDSSCVKAGYMWHATTRESEELGIRADIVTFMPVWKNIEIMQVKISNTGDGDMKLIPTAAIPVYGRSADNIRDHRHVTAMLHRGTVVNYGLEIRPTLSFDERGHQINDTAYYVYGMEEDGIAPIGCIPEQAAFLGHGGSLLWPEAITGDVKPEDLLHEGDTLDGQELIGALCFDETVLAPGASRIYTVYLGICKNTEHIGTMMQSLLNLEEVEAEFAKTKEYWLEKVNVSYHTADPAFDEFMAWVSFQPELRRVFGCSFLPHHDYGKGGRGWRDLWQDCLALLIMNPTDVHKMLVSNFGGVRMDGTNATIIGNALGEFKADRNSITRVWMDHGVWPMVTTKLYMNQTGDTGILYETAPYFKDRQVVRGTAVDNEWTPDMKWQQDVNGKEYQGTVLEHLLLQNVAAFYEVGEHNHIRLRDADWNDAIDMAGKRGESVAFTNAYAMNLSDLADVLERELKNGVKDITIAKEIVPLLEVPVSDYDSIEAKKAALDAYAASCVHFISGEQVTLTVAEVITDLRGKAEWIRNHIRATEWVGDGAGANWYNGYYDNSGLRVEGAEASAAAAKKTGEADTTRMMLTGQVFSIMAETATDEQVAQIAAAADQYLYDEKCGGYRLNTDFHEVKTDMGRMFGFAFGEKENGAVFSHMAVMYANALYQRGFAKEGYKSLQALYKQSMDFSVSRIYPGIPEYFGKGGRGLYHYLTGAASWYMLTVITCMFGAKGENGDLKIEPKLLAEQFDQAGKAALKMQYAGAKFTITIENPQRKEYGEYHVAAAAVNGVSQAVEASAFVLAKSEIKEGATYDVVLTLA